MFRMFVHDHKHQREIAAVLNEEQIRTDLGRRWTAGSVGQVLTNEKYIGNNVFNRASAKLKNKRVANPPEMWIRAIGAFPAIVDPELFRAAQAVFARRYRQLSDDEMLALLEELYAKHGRLSSIIIDQAKDLPVSLTYRQRFGSLGRAYRLVGYTPDRAERPIEINRALRCLHADVYRQVISEIEQRGGSVARDGAKGLISVNGEFTSAIVITRCLRTRSGNAMRWNVRLDTALRPDITIAMRLAPDNEWPMDYYLLLPLLDIKAARLRLAERNAIFLDAYRFDTARPVLADRRAGAHAGCRMTTATDVQMIPVDEITVLNPRARNRRVFHELVTSIAYLGLKRPITVSRRDASRVTT